MLSIWRLGRLDCQPRQARFYFLVSLHSLIRRPITDSQDAAPRGRRHNGPLDSPPLFTLRCKMRTGYPENALPTQEPLLRPRRMSRLAFANAPPESNSLGNRSRRWYFRAALASIPALDPAHFRFASTFLNENGLCNCRSVINLPPAKPETDSIMLSPVGNFNCRWPGALIVAQRSELLKEHYFSSFFVKTYVSGRMPLRYSYFSCEASFWSIPRRIDKPLNLVER